MNQQALQLDCIFFRFGDLSVLQGIYLKVKAGSVCALFGKNGSGKSTLMKIAAGQLQADSGITIVDGQRIHLRDIDHRFMKLAYLPQESMLPDDITVLRILDSFAVSCEIRQDPIIDRIYRQKIAELSGGERKYLEVISLFSLDRKYYLLDEPFTGVEPMLIERICDRIKSAAAQGKGILVTDHYHHYLVDLADSACLLRDKQCRELKGDIKGELEEQGYLAPSKRGASGDRVL